MFYTPSAKTAIKRENMLGAMRNLNTTGTSISDSTGSTEMQYEPNERKNIGRIKQDIKPEMQPSMRLRLASCNAKGVKSAAEEPRCTMTIMTSPLRLGGFVGNIISQ